MLPRRLSGMAQLTRGLTLHALGGSESWSGGQSQMQEAADVATVVDLDSSHGQLLFGFARRLGLSDEQADDAVQDALLRLWAELGRGTRIENAKGWAYRTVYRLAMDQHRLRRRLSSLVDVLGRSTMSAEDPQASDRVAVWTEVDRLPHRQRQILYLRYRADLTFEEVGQALGITASAARSHCAQAMATLRRRFAAAEDISDG